MTKSDTGAPDLGRLMSRHEALKLTNLGRTKADQLERKGRFPKRRKPLGPGGRVMYVESELRAYIACVAAGVDYEAPDLAAYREAAGV